METKAARRRTFDVEYVIVSEENIEEVADWSKGTIGGEGVDGYIRLQDKNAINQRQTKAFVGDYVVKYGKSFKSFTDSAFEKAFEEIPEVEDTVRRPVIKVKHARSAKTGKFVSAKEAESNPDTTVIELFYDEVGNPLTRDEFEELVGENGN